MRVAAAASALLPLAASMSAETAPMWAELERHCAAGLCEVAEGSKLGQMANTTDCKGRLLAYEYGLKLLPERKPQLESFDALQLADNCGVTRPAAVAASAAALPQPDGLAWHVHPEHGDDGASGEEHAPFRSIARALAATRASSSATPKSVVLQAGVHYLNATIELGAADSGLTITAAPGAEGKVTVSGGLPLKPTWTKSTKGNQSANIWVTAVPELAGVEVLRGLTTREPHRRVTRAREPNADPTEGAELCTRCWHNRVTRWHSDLSCVGKASVVYKDLRNCDDEHKIASGPLAGQPCKNDSAMWDTYNTYSSGHGGCCAAWSGDHSPYGPMGNYFCGNSSAGGWVGYDDPRQGNSAQGLSPALPVGFDYDPEDAAYAPIEDWADPAGGIMHVWRAQGWFVNMFEIAGKGSGPHSIDFAKTEGGWVKGGWQGGRGWQVNHANIKSTTENYLLAGQWMIENVREAMDGETQNPSLCSLALEPCQVALVPGMLLLRLPLWL